MTELELAAPVEAELPAVLALLEANALPTAGVREGMARFVVGRLHEQVVACCGLETYGEYALLRSLVVDARHRGASIAAKLMEHVLSRGAAAGIVETYLLTTTARDYFQRFGFRDCPRSEAPDGIRSSWEFRTGCPDTAVLMLRSKRDS